VIRPEVFDAVARAGYVQGRRWPSTTVAVCVWLYLAAVLAVWLLLRLAGDRWWFATVILFGPRWLCALPLAVLAPAAVLFQRRLLWVLATAAIVVFVPVMGLCIPWARLAAGDGPSLRVLTCNVKGQCNNAALDDLIEQTAPDIVALQGCWGDVHIRWPTGWHVRQEAGFVVASRFPVVLPGSVHSWQLAGNWPHVDMFHCAVRADGREIEFCSVHLRSPHDGLDAVRDRKTLLRPSDGPILDAEIEERRLESEDARRFVRDFGPASILAGDFNMPVDSSIYRRYWSDYRDAFSDAGLGFGYTEWPRLRVRLLGVRIDHVLTGKGWRCRRCWVGPDVGSDHLPLLADITWQD
jgi:vancomycin resistance protein VanJ